MDAKYVAVLLEEIKSQNEVLLEGMDALSSLPQRVGRLEEDMQEVKAELRIIRIAVTDTNKDLRDHEKRLTRLEAA